MFTDGLNCLLREARIKLTGLPYPHQIASLLDNPLRRALDNPACVVDGIGLCGYEHVLELGPGPGFFSVELASRLTTGRLELFDVQPEMLDRARRKLEHAGYGNTGYRAGDASDGVPFCENSFDVAFLAQVIGELPDPATCLRSLVRVIKPGGLLVFVESFPDPDRLSISDLRRIAEPHGFTFLGAHHSRWQDVVHFTNIGRSSR